MLEKLIADTLEAMSIRLADFTTDKEQKVLDIVIGFYRYMDDRRKTDSTAPIVVDLLRFFNEEGDIEK